MSRIACSFRWLSLTVLLTVVSTLVLGQTPNPQIAGISPTSGAVGTQITITGTGFGATAGTASVNWTNASIQSWSDTQVVATVGGGTTTGGVRVVNGGVTSNAVTFTLPNPQIASISPTSGAVGTQITITGTGFGATAGTASVNWTNASIQSWSDTQVVATVGGGTTTGGVRVVNGGVTSNAVTFTIGTSLSSLTIAPPNPSFTLNSSAPVQFRLTGNYSDGSTQDLTAVATWSTSNSAIAELLPAANMPSVVIGVSAGTAVITGAYQGLTASSAINVLPAPPPQNPTITSISPTSGPLGTQVAISGSGFGPSQGSGYVQVGSAPGSVISWSDTQILAAVASGSTSGVVQVFQGGVNSNSVSFVVNTATIVAVTPSSGAAGTQVAITGSGFGATQGSGMVWLGTAQGVVTSWSDTEVDATVAPGSFSGNVQVLQNGVWSNSVPFSVPGNPRISSISPTSGPVGTTVTIIGSGFGSSQGSSTVWIGGAYASILAWGDTQIQASVASNAVTGIVKVQENATWSNTVAFSVSGSSNPVTLVPDALNMVVGESRSIQAVDSNGQLVTGLAWSSSDPTIASLSTDDPPIITALAAGNVTITGGNASADLTVTSGSLPLGTIIWSNPGDGSGVQQIVPAVPSPTGVADVFAQQNDCSVQAIASDGTLAWTRNIGAPGSGYGCKSVVPDFQGGFLAVDSGNRAYLSSSGSVQKFDGMTGQPYPAYSIANFRTTPYHEPVLPVAHTDGTIFTVDGDSVVAVDPTTGLPKFSANMEHSISVQSGCGTSNTDNLPSIGSNLIIAGDGYAYLVYSYTVQSVQQIVCGQGNNYTEHDEIHVRLLRVGSGGDSSTIVLADSSQDITVSPLTNGTQITQVGANPAYNEFLQPIITNQNQGVLVALNHDDPTYCASTTAINNGPTTYSGCTRGTGSYYTLITTSGSSIVSQTAVPGSIDYIIPILQAQDGTYYGVIDHTGINTDFLGKFDQNGNVQWSVPNYYAVIATADGGVIAQTETNYPYNTTQPSSVPYYSAGVTFDQNGNQTGQIASLPTQSWTGTLYQQGSVDDILANPTLIATTLWAEVAGNPSSNSAASRPWYFRLTWNNAFDFIPSNPTILPSLKTDISYDASSIKRSALNALKKAYKSWPVTVFEGTKGGDGSAMVETDSTSQGPSCGFTSPNQTPPRTSTVLYECNMEQAQIALQVVVNNSQDEATALSNQQLILAIGRGIGATAAHELAHQFLGKCCSMDVLISTDPSAAATYNNGDADADPSPQVVDSDPSPYTGYWKDGKTPIHWETTTQNALTKCLAAGWTDYNLTLCAVNLQLSSNRLNVDSKSDIWAQMRVPTVPNEPLRLILPGDPRTQRIVLLW